MPSSISSSDQAPGAGGSRAPSYFGAACRFLAAVLLCLLALSYGGGRAYRPVSLAVSDDDLARSERLLLFFGNSRTQAAFDMKQIGEGLGVGCRMFSGGGWHPMHYEQLAILNAPRLRAGRDAVAIDVSLLSLDGEQPPAHLGIIRPEAALAVATLPGLPFESRLDILLGAINGVYRYRPQIQLKLQSPLERVASSVGGALGALGLEGPAPASQPYRFIAAPNGFMMQEIQGDVGAFRQERLAWLRRTAPAITLAPYQIAAVERSIELLKARGVDVILVEVPISRTFTRALEGRSAVREHREAIDAMARRTGSLVVRDWPDALLDDANFYDFHHLYSSATAAASRAFIDSARARLSPPP